VLPPPWAPLAVIVIVVTQAGTVHVVLAPVYEKLTVLCGQLIDVTVKHEVGLFPQALLAYTQMVYVPVDAVVVIVAEVVPCPPVTDARLVLEDDHVYEVALATVAIVYVEAVLILGDVGPEGIAGAEGILRTVTASMLAPLVPQLLLAVTVTLPDVVPMVTVIEVVPVPAVIVAPAGTVQVYEVALATAAMEYTLPVVEAHAVTGPVIAPGVAGGPEQGQTTFCQAKPL